MTHAIVRLRTTKLSEEHFFAIPFIKNDEILYKRSVEKMEKLYIEHHLLTWTKIEERVVESNHALFNHIAAELATVMTRVTTNLWKDKKGRRNSFGKRKADGVARRQCHQEGECGSRPLNGNKR